MDLNAPEQQKILLIEQLKQLKNLSEENIDDVLNLKQKETTIPGKEEEITKLIDCAHEIVFSITAHVLMQNELGELTGTKELCVKNYHIPVPIDKDYHNYMSTFFEYLETKMIDAVNHTNSSSKDK